ncbi:MAG: FAA hydrolase family protein [Xanthobacteraceae bacterium]|nr:MAG: FAA hydrolase family protein [Xanthobacteraceae bacterium]
MRFVIAPPLISSIAVAGSTERFPVRRIICVGRNYEAHAREMGRDPTREAPFFFTKPADTVVENKATVPYPPDTKNFHHEIELVVAIGRDGFNIALARACDYIYGYSVGIDLTRRDLQLQAREQGRPWDWGKAFDQSAPIAPIEPVSRIGHPKKGRIWLSINGAIRQDADIADLIWSVPEIVTIASQSIRLKAGDIIMTGTPAGVGAMTPGDHVEGGIDGIGTIEITIGEPEKT